MTYIILLFIINVKPKISNLNKSFDSAWSVKIMKKSSALIMLVPGLVILLVCLAIPLLRVLAPSIFSGDYPFSFYTDFFRDGYYMKIFLRTVKIAVITTAFCMAGGIPTAYFISRCPKKYRGCCWRYPFFP